MDLSAGKIEGFGDRHHMPVVDIAKCLLHRVQDRQKRTRHVAVRLDHRPQLRIDQRLGFGHLCSKQRKNHINANAHLANGPDSYKLLLLMA